MAHLGVRNLPSLSSLSAARLKVWNLLSPLPNPLLPANSFICLPRSCGCPTWTQLESTSPALHKKEKTHQPPPFEIFAASVKNLRSRPLCQWRGGGLKTPLYEAVNMEENNSPIHSPWDWVENSEEGKKLFFPNFQTSFWTFKFLNTWSMKKGRFWKKN